MGASGARRQSPTMGGENKNKQAGDAGVPMALMFFEKHTGNFPVEFSLTAGTAGTAGPWSDMVNKLLLQEISTAPNMTNTLYIASCEQKHLRL